MRIFLISIFFSFIISNFTLAQELPKAIKDNRPIVNVHNNNHVHNTNYAPSPTLYRY